MNNNLFRITVKGKYLGKTKTFYVAMDNKKDAISYITKYLRDGYSVHKTQNLGSAFSGCMWGKGVERNE